MRYQINKNKFLSDDELKNLYINLTRRMKHDHDKFLPVLVALKTGCRRSELLILKVRDVSFTDQTIFITATKSSNDREMPVETEVLSALKAYIRRNKMGPEELLFPISKSAIFRRWVDVRPVAKGFHSLRHTFAINIFRVHKDIRLVQVALGHRSIQNTLVYSEYIYSKEELRRLLVRGPE